MIYYLNTITILIYKYNQNETYILFSIKMKHHIHLWFKFSWWRKMWSKRPIASRNYV